MTAIKAIVRDRRLELDVPADWPDGIEVEIHPVAMDPEAPLSPAGIASTLAAMDQIVPLDLTDAEKAAWETERRHRKEWEKSRFAEHADNLRKMWE